MKHAFAASLALCGAAILASPAIHASGADHTMQLAHSGHGHNHGGHAHHAAPSQEDIAAMPIASSVAISDCWIRLLPSPAPSAGYFNAGNQGKTPVTLTAAASARYGQVMLHQTTHTDGMSRMSSVQGVEIPAGETLEFKPGGYHVMLEKPVSEVKIGDTVAMQFLFASGEKAEAACEVKPANTLAK